MKNTGMVKKIDELGRLVIPKDIRLALGIDKENVEFFMDGDKLIVTKWNAHCIFCGGTDDLAEHKEKLICSACRNAIAAK